MESNSNKYIQLVGGFVAIVFGVLQGIDWIFKKYDIDSFYFNIILIILLISFIISLIIYFRKRRIAKNQNKSLSKKSKINLFIGVVLTALLILIFVYFFRKININQSLVNETIPELIKLYDKGEINQTFLKSKMLVKEFPNNEIIKNYFDKSSRYVYLKVNVDGASVHIKYNGDSIFRFIGQTPIDSFLVANTSGSHKIKLSYQNLEFIQESNNFHNYILPLSSQDKIDNHKLLIGREFRWMRLQGLDFSQVKINPFSISKNEVSNKEYLEFLESDGYSNPKYWDFPILINGENIDFKSAIKLFKGKYGKPGPSNWSYGNYPSDLDNSPVTGISWFEARAYARYKNLDLPNIFQWLYASGSGVSSIYDSNVLNFSNFNSNQIREVSDTRGSNGEINNIAGNVKEWLTNPFGENKSEYSILGGSYLESPYYFKNYSSLSPFDRSLGNGIRLVKNFNQNDKKYNDEIIPDFYRDVTKIPDVSDDAFEVYKSQFYYKNFELNTQTEISDDFQSGYILEEFSLTPAYESEEKLNGYIIYSKEFKQKLNPVIVFPSAGALVRDTVDGLPNSILNNFKYLIDEGFAIIHPIYFNTYNRERSSDTWVPNETEDYKEMVLKMGKDYLRSLDYLETRNDFNFGNLSYYGYSLGSRYANFMLAIDDRVKSAFICAGGIRMQKSKKEIDEHYYVRRIKTPIFHMVGKLDGTLGYEDVYLPWKKLIGTDEKNLISLELEDFGHGLPKDSIIKYHQNWIKKYFTE